MTIRHLKIFINVAETGNMSTAAAKLFISQPTVSQAIRELEEHYGVLLFERLNRRLYITDSGRRLFSYAKDVVKEFDALEDKMFNMNNKEKIKIGVTMTVGECALANISHRLRTESKGIEIYSYMNNTEIIEQKLLNGEIDIGIVEGEVKSKDLVSIPEIKDRLVLICSTKHPFAKRETIRLSDLGNERFAMREKGSGTRELFERYMLENNVAIQSVFESNNPETIKKEVINNQALAVLSICLVDEEVRNSQIHIIENLEGSWNRYFSVVYHKNKVITEGMKSLMDIMRDYKTISILTGLESGKLIK